MDAAAATAKQHRIRVLVAWATEHGARIHPSVELYDDVQTGFSFRVRPGAAPLPASEPVVAMPTALTLSYLNAPPLGDTQPRDPGQEHQLPSVFSESLLAATPPHVVGHLFLAYEFLRGRDSFWWPYIQALPQPDDLDAWALPPFWLIEEAELLEGTNVEVGIDKIRADVAREFADVVARLGPNPALTVDLYRWAYCIFSSRSFRPDLVLSDAQRRRLPAGVSLDDFSVLFPLFDIGNHDMTTPVCWRLDNARQTCALCVALPHGSGEQIFNNYSMKTNAELLLGYGFIIPATDALHNDYTHVRKRTTTAPVPSDEYLISLRPLAHPSSLLARSRQTLRLQPLVKLLGAFQHVQPDMVWDIFCTLAPAALHERLIPALGKAGKDAERHRRDMFFSGHVEGEGRLYLEQVIILIQNKVLQELGRLNETDVEAVCGDFELLSPHKRLALDYRERCRRVLENTLETMSKDELQLGLLPEQ